jgi:hypothetical protein
LFIALFMNKARQQYALRAAHSAFDAAKVMTGMSASDQVTEGVQPMIPSSRPAR